MNFCTSQKTAQQKIMSMLMLMLLLKLSHPSHKVESSQVDQRDGPSFLLSFYIVPRS